MKKPEQFDELINSFNFNNNRLVAIDTFATTKDEIIELCIYPMNANFELAKTIIPLNIVIQPEIDPSDLSHKDFHSLGVTAKMYIEAWEEGIPAYQAIDLFQRWCENKIKMIPGRRLMPLTYDWATKKAQIIELIGPKHFEYYFHFHARDILSVSLFANDFANMQVERPPYPKVDMAYIFSQTRTEYDRKNTMINCAGIASIYNKMISSFYSGHVRTGR